MSKSLTLDKIINFITSIGAAIVVFGAWMKITHRENADTFLTIGLITEAIIFCLYAFLPPKTTEPQTLSEFIPKRSDGGNGSITSKIDEHEVERLNKNLNNLNGTLEKIQSIFK